MKILIFYLIVAIELCCGQSDHGYQSSGRGGHYISNGKYQNQGQLPPFHNSHYSQQQPSSVNVIGNNADNIYGNSHGTAVNSVINPSHGSSVNVIGNMASNIYGGTVNSVVNPSSKWVLKSQVKIFLV